MILCILLTLQIFQIILCLGNTPNTCIQHVYTITKIWDCRNDDNTPLTGIKYLEMISHKLKNLFTMQSIEKIETCLILNLFQIKNNLKIQTFTNL